MVIKKRCLLWDWTNTAHIPEAMEYVNFEGPLSSCSNWNAWAPPELKNRLPFRPTVRGLSQLSDPNEWGMISNNDHTILHFFNEPERAGISPETAAQLWAEKIVPLRRDQGKKIIGPGCASDPGGEAWLDAFMKRVEVIGEPPDYLGVHYYGPNGKAAIEYIEKIHDRFPEYQVAISEIACISRNKMEVFAFTSEVAIWCDHCPWIFEYSFFGCMRELADSFVSPEAQLMNPDGTSKYLMQKIMREQPMRRSMDAMSLVIRSAIIHMDTVAKLPRYNNTKCVQYPIHRFDMKHQEENVAKLLISDTRKGESSVIQASNLDIKYILELRSMMSATGAETSIPFQTFEDRDGGASSKFHEPYAVQGDHPQDSQRQELQAQELQDETVEEPKKKSFKFKVTIFMICLISTVAAMDSVIVAATLPAIVVSLKGTSLEAFWVGTSYLLAQTVVIPIYGTISDIFGRKWVMVVATGLFLFGSILCSSAQNMNWLLAARVVQGLGGGGCLALGTVIISDITMLRERPKFLAIIAFSWALGTNIGVPLGGAIGEFTTWRWAFWINIPICVVGLTGLVYALHLHQEISSLRSKLARIDYIGMAIFVTSTTLMLYGLTTGGTAEPWNSANVLAPLIIGIVGLGVFVVVEWKVAKEPMVPVRIFSNRTANAGFSGAFIHGLVLWAGAYYMIIFFLGARGDALFKSAAETLPGSTPIAISAVFCGILVAKTLRFQKLTWIAWAILTSGTGLNALMKPNSNAGILFVLRIVPAIGGGFLFQLPLYAVQATTVDNDLGIATSTMTFFRSIGQALGVAIGGTVFQNQFDSYLHQAAADVSIPHDLVVTGAQAAGAYSTIATFPDAVQIAYRYIYADALRTVWYVTTGIAGAGLILSLLIRNESMDRGNVAKRGFKEKAVEKNLGAA